MNVALLQEVLSVPTYSRKEQKMVDFLHNYLLSKGIRFHTDSIGNVYAVKGETSGFYPCVCAHTDTVHPGDDFHVVLQDGRFVAFDKAGMRVGLGGDDKAGVFVCLELLEAFPVLKAAFFVAEEIGCVGSKAADSTFFEDVGYCIEWDSPNNDILSFSNDGVQLCLEEGKFLRIADPILARHGAVKWQHHPYTDVAQLRRKFDFECLNLPCGYYHMHTEQEYVQVSDTARAVELGKRLIEALGTERYFMPRGDGITPPKRSVTGLILD